VLADHGSLLLEVSGGVRNVAWGSRGAPFPIAPRRKFDAMRSECVRRLALERVLMSRGAASLAGRIAARAHPYCAGQWQRRRCRDRTPVADVLQSVHQFRVAAAGAAVRNPLPVAAGGHTVVAPIARRARVKQLFKLVVVAGVEPAAERSRIPCSTDELRDRFAGAG
jgi:hypothetical protein